MSTTQQPETLRLADALAYCDASVASQAAAELRRLHAALAHAERYAEQMGRELSKATAEIADLRAKLEVSPLMGAAGDAEWRTQFDDWWRRNRVATHQVKSIGGFSAKVWLAAIQTVVGAMDSTAGFYPADEGSTTSRQAATPSSAKGVAHG